MFDAADLRDLYSCESYCVLIDYALKMKGDLSRNGFYACDSQAMEVLEIRRKSAHRRRCL